MIFFDLDGTLLDHDSAERHAALAFCARHADVFGPADASFVRRWREVSEKHLARYFAGEIDFAGQRRARLVELFAASGRALAPADADERFAHYLAAYRDHWVGYPDVSATLEALSGRRLGVITNGDLTQQREKLQRIGLGERFELVVASGACGVSKPDPRIFLEACRRAGVLPARCVYVGDRLDTDARASAAAGMRGVWLDRSGGATAETGVDVIRALDALPALLES